MVLSMLEYPFLLQAKKLKNYFIQIRCVQPVYGFIVMNRLGIDNFMAPLTDSMELEFKDEYIIYRTTDDGIVDDFFEVRQYFVI
jgi:hypothetical protein